jgi:hypothetical protein
MVVVQDIGRSPDGSGYSAEPEPSCTVSAADAVSIPNADDPFDRLMDAHQTLIRLKPGDVLTQAMIDDLLLVERDYRDNDERNTDAFHKGYEAGLERGSNADTAKLIDERDAAQSSASIANAIRTFSEVQAFKRGAQACREMMARFVEAVDPVTANSIRLNWRPSWGDDPGTPTEISDLPEISAKPLTEQVSA